MGKNNKNDLDVETFMKEFKLIVDELKSHNGRFEKQMFEMEQMIHDQQSVMSNLTIEVKSNKRAIGSLYEQRGISNPMKNRTPSIVQYDAIDSFPAFTASPTNYYNEYNLGDVVIFDGITTNIGSYYDPVSSVFTCPIDGIYVFSVNARADSAGEALID